MNKTTKVFAIVLVVMVAIVMWTTAWTNQMTRQLLEGAERAQCLPDFEELVQVSGTTYMCQPIDDRM
jgi:hypothetical protein